MTSPDIPGQPQQLREQIEQTRAELGGTVEALAAKTDVKTRAKNALGEAAGRSRQQLAVAKVRAAEVTGTARQKVSEASRHPTVRRAAPPAVAVAAVAATVIIVVQRRRAARRVRSRPASWLDRYR